MPETAEDVMAQAAMHLRMILLGYTSYSASVTEVDKGHGRLLLDRIRALGFDVLSDRKE